MREATPSVSMCKQQHNKLSTMYWYRRYGCLQVRLGDLQKYSQCRKKESLLQIKIQSETKPIEMRMRTRLVCTTECHEQQGIEMLSYDLRTTCTDYKTVKLVT